MSETRSAAFRARADFHETESGVFEVDALDFAAEVTVGEDTVTLVHQLPTLDATVVGEPVAPVVEEGWEETFERRVADVTGVVDPVSGPTVETDGKTVRVTMDIDDRGKPVPEAVRHAVDFIESTWVEGIIPGYEYDEQVQKIRNRAMETGENGTRMG
ncbi:MAG: DUF5813 family protein [Halodesulfurarchaeum sp.]|nr:DUF5813 family protein [Halodesulfurarchaeum sp.]